MGVEAHNLMMLQKSRNLNGGLLNESPQVRKLQPCPGALE
jgi:hypothetical protein